MSSNSLIASSRSYFLRNILFLSWLCAIPILLFIIIPNTDDISYGLPAVSFVANGHMAMPVGKGGFEYVYYNMPTTSFIESGLYWMMVKLIHLPLNFYTYRIPIALFFVGSLLLVFKNIQRIGSYVVTRQILFLIFLGTSLFAQTWINNRPETIVVFFFTLHLFLFYKWRENPSRTAAFFAGLSLAMMPVLHPQFVLIGLMILVIDCYLLYQKRISKGFIVFLLGGILPALAILFFYWHHMPRSWEVLHNQLMRAGQAAPFAKLFHGAFLHYKSQAVLLTNIVFFVPSILLFIYGCYISILKVIHKQLKDYELHAMATLVGSFVVLWMSWGEPYTGGICMFFVIYAFVFLVKDGFCACIEKFTNRYLVLTAVVGCIMVAFFAEMHIAKFALFSDRYMFPQHMINRMHAAMREHNAKLLMAGGPYMSLFMGDFYREFKHPETNQSVYWVLPSGGQFDELPQDRVQGKLLLKNIIETKPNVILLSVPSYLTYNKKTGDAHLSYHANSQLRYDAHFKKELYNVGQHVAILADQFKLRDLSAS